MSDYTDPNVLWDLWVVEGMSQKDIANRLNCSVATICNWVKEHNLSDVSPLNNGPSVWYNGEYDNPYEDSDILKNLYYDRLMDAYEISNIMNCSNVTIIDWLRNHGLGVRMRSEAKKVRFGTHNCVRFFTSQNGPEVWEDCYKSEHNKVFVHRLLAVAEFGFEALHGMVVHHKNGVHWDNRPDNIEVMSQSDHATLHNKERLKNGTHPFLDETDDDEQSVAEQFNPTVQEGGDDQ